MEENENKKPQKFNVPDELISKSLQATKDGLESDDEREKSVAVRTVIIMTEADRKTIEFEAKEARLDAGKPTDIISSLDQFQAQIDEDENILDAAGYGSAAEEEEGAPGSIEGAD